MSLVSNLSVAFGVTMDVPMYMDAAAPSMTYYCPECPPPPSGTGVLPGTLYQQTPRKSTGHTRRSNGRGSPSRRR
jgi:hypothetical protein